jgi:hypothetical protein
VEDVAEGERVDARGYVSLVHFDGGVMLTIVRAGTGVGGGLDVPGTSGCIGPGGNAATMAGLVRFVRALGSQQEIAERWGGELVRSGTRIRI